MVDHPKVEILEHIFISSFPVQIDQSPEHILAQFNKELSITTSDWILFCDEQEILGYIIIEEHADLTSLFFRKCCIPNTLQQENVLKNAFMDLLKTYPECLRCHLLLQEVHKKGFEFSSTIGFIPSSFSHQDFDPEIYSGYTYTIPK